MSNSYCTECGNKIREDFKVCPYCGKKLYVEQKKKYCSLCGTVLNEDETCLKCIEEPKKFNIFGLLSFLFSIASIFILMFAPELQNEVLSDIFLLLFIVFGIAGFILQFFGRKKSTAKIWKVFSWISFGIGLFVLTILFIAILLAVVEEIPNGVITDF